MTSSSDVSASSDPAESDPAQALWAEIHRRRDEYVAFLRRLVQAESPSTDPDAQAEVQRLLSDALADLGFATMRLPGTATGGALYARPARRSRGRPRQLLLGHSDTVWDHGTLADMPVEIDDGTMRGPGVFDMKAGLASIVFALRALEACGMTPTVCPLVLVTSDEEIGSPESRRHVERLARCSERVFVLEPALGTEGKIKTARKGTGELTVTVRTTAAPPEGNVVLELSHLVQRLNALHDLDRGVTVNVGTIDAGAGAEDGPSAGSLEVDVRVPTEEEADWLGDVMRDLDAETPGVALDVQGGLNRPPMERTSGTQRLWGRARQLGRRLGLDLEEGRSGGASDGNFTSQHAATLDGLGAVGGGAHADHEHIHVEQTLDRCALLALLLLAPSLSEGQYRQEAEGRS